MEQQQPQQVMPLRARLFVRAVAVVALAGMIVAFRGNSLAPQPRFLIYLLLALISSGMKVGLPGVKTTLSPNFILIVLSLVELTLSQTLIIAVSSAAAQMFWHARLKVKPVQLVFNPSCLILATLAATWVYRLPGEANTSGTQFLWLMLAGVAYFLVNNGLLAVVITLADGEDIRAVVRGLLDWSVCYYPVGVSLAEIVHVATERLGWAFSLALLPPLYLVYRSVRLYFSKMEQDKAHAESVAALHLRTIEALATAIEAKDECTGDHLRRVQVYSLEMGRHLGLSPDEMNALQAASILHDIGKLAVPDYIISKPGKLTPDEFEKMKVHTVVGAEILEQVAFPYPVAPIVRSHHEKWDGTGYPDGLKAQDIPIGARILAAVDCLDALASDRQYRRALPLDEAMEYVAGLSGKSFDPQVVETLNANYQEFERLAQSTPLRNHKLSKDLVVGRGAAPDAGYEKSATVAAGAGGTPADSIAKARQEIQGIVDLSTDLTKSLRMEDILSMMAERLKHLAPYDCLAIYVRDRTVLKLRYMSGPQTQRFSGAEVPVGQGLSGWVVENGKAIVNGNPAVEPGYIDASDASGALNSALSIPLGDGTDSFSGALTLYRAEKDAFSSEHLRLLLAIKGDIARAVDGAIRFQKAKRGSGADELTGLPARAALVAHLQEGFAAQHKPATLLVCDIDEFGRINELHGRPVGDQMLKVVANVLRNNSRSGDYLARVGADEFALLLPTRVEEFSGKMESLDRLVAKACRELCGEETSGLAIGVARFPENGSDAESLVAFAVQAMEQAKEQRRASRSEVLRLEHSLQRPA